MQEQIERDLKAALLAGDKKSVETLKVVKSALQYEAVSKNKKSEELSEEETQAVISREAKKRAEAAELYTKAGEKERAAAELSEKAILDRYLPEQMSEEEVKKLVDEVIGGMQAPTIKDMGQIIGAVRAKSQGAADGSIVARLVKERLEQ